MQVVYIPLIGTNHRKFGAMVVHLNANCKIIGGQKAAWAAIHVHMTWLLCLSHSEIQT